MSEAEDASAKGVSSEPNPSKGPAYDPVTAKQIQQHHQKLRFHLDAIRDIKAAHAEAVRNRQPKARPMATGQGPVQAAPKQLQLGSSKSSPVAEQPPVKSRPQAWHIHTEYSFLGCIFFSFDVGKPRAKPAMPKATEPKERELGQTCKQPPTRRRDYWMRELEVAFLDQSVDCRTPATASGSFGPICPPPPAVVPGPGP